MPVFQSNLLPPNLRNVHSAQVTQDGSNRLPAKISDFNFLLFVFQVWESTLASKDGLRDTSVFHEPKVAPL
jgi:hypothetical protein